MTVEKLAKKLTEKYQCSHCPKTYDDKESLESHVQANHWKKLRTSQKGKP